MPDVFTKKKRSEVMARIRSRGNRETELRMAKLLRKSHVSGWRRHTRLLGRPDFSFPKRRLALFIDGCFWHRCPKCSNVPVNNRKFWLTKLTANARRDKLVTLGLRRLGWRVVRVWEHELVHPNSVMSKLIRYLSPSRKPTSRR